MTVRSYAKINLGLRILGKRPDGYHDLLTIFHYIDLYDTLMLASADVGASMRCNRADLPSDDRNLCIMAAKAVLALSGGGGVRIELEKRIPAGAGLGGGSSNAAAVLRALPSLLGMSIPPERLHILAAEIGSDVPFFLQDSSAEAAGRGEILHPISLSLPWWIVTTTPPIHVSTAWAYASLRRAGVPSAIDLAAPRRHNFMDEALLPHALTNDFEPTVMTAHPEIAALRDQMLASGAVASAMSGSGSSVFGLYRDGAAARSAGDRFASRMTVSITAPDFSPAFHGSGV